MPQRCFLSVPQSLQPVFADVFRIVDGHQDEIDGITISQD